MRKVLLLAALLLLTLTACGGGDTTVPPPPQSRAYESGDSAEVDAIISGWRTAAPDSMRADGVKPETIVEEIYVSDASLEEISAHYAALTNSGWWHLRRMPGLQERILLDGYEHGTTSLVIGAIDAAQFGGQGTVIYTLKGVK